MRSTRTIATSVAAAGALLAVTVSAASAHPESSELDDGFDEGGDGTELVLPWGDGDEKAHEEPPGGSTLPDTIGASGSQTVDVVGRGMRNDFGATTDVWAHDGYAYTGTFNDPCGGDPEAGIWVWDVHNANKVDFVTIIQSPTGSRTNDVRVAAMNSGDVLVHSNESCAGGPGGFEVYNVDDPANPVYLSSVRIDEQNPITPLFFAPGALEDVGVHNLFLFTQGDRDFVAVTSEGVFDNFQIWELTDPATPTRTSSWGAEELFDPGVGDETADVGRVLNAAIDLFSGFGASQNKFLHDVTVSADGTMAYLANWDAGLVLLDISDPANPSVVSVALDPVNGSLDGEVNSHSVWPSEDGSIVIEGEEDFSAWEGSIPPGNLTLDGTATPGDPTIPATAIATDAGDFFEANQTGLTGTVHGASVEVDGGPEFAAEELATAAGSPTLADTGDISGNIVWVGRACGLTQGDVLENPVAAGDIAVVRRGACEFQEKADTVAAAGAAVAVIANQQPSTPWSGFRIWDYSDPANPVLASTFDTACSASTAPSSSCVADGTYSSHNVIVETLGNKVLAYIAWYNDGVIVLDISDPYSPVEVARYLGTNEAGDLNDFWGIYKEPNNPFIYASDRNGGLYVLKMKGKGLQNGGN
ncbi:LVIVD repeat-containing protein [Ilumatobacter sp.]|uniref:LVIVD repeat-containing protein n=1 Tax=Ilumatobacter sp. TaxID=1967498 RepID=UPI003AF774CB